MRKISILLVICLIFTCMPHSTLAEEITYTDTLRVGLSYGSSGPSEAYFYSESPISVVDAYYMSYIATIPAYTKCMIYNYGGSLASDYFAPINSAIRLDSASVIEYNDDAYRGSFELRCADDKVTVINVVDTEEYLASLLGKEMSASWPIEALKAQAVCARNYAITMLDRHSSYGFDICDTTHCQVYAGISSEAEKTRQAVLDTKGVTVTYEGEVVPLYYFSCDGGYTEDSENVWINPLGYLRGKKDIHESAEYATRYNWSVTYTKAEIENMLATRNINIGELTDIRIDEISDNNGVIKLTFVGTLGEKSVTKTETRTTLSLYSQAYTIAKNSNAPVINEVPEVVTYSVLTANGLVSVTNPKYTMTGDGLTEITYGTVKVQEESDYYDSYTFNGHGWGHLVGMSQWGAYSMAVNGYTYKDILNFYFTDIVIEEAPKISVPPIDETEEIADEEYTEAEYTEEDIYEPDEEVTEPYEGEEYEETQWSDTGI